tara:strand:- start:28 stop:501 length:474 start_codon:yes stop_codon:yes gene_type:complete
MARPRSVSNHECTLEEAVDTFKSSVEDLKDEIEDWKSNLEGNDMTHLPKYEELKECVSILEEVVDKLEDVELPDVVKELEVSYTQRTRKVDCGRNNRMANATTIGESASCVLVEWVDEQNDGDVDNIPDSVDEASSASDRLEEAIDQCNEVDFPRMY